MAFLREPGVGEKIGDHHDGAVECATAWLERVAYLMDVLHRLSDWNPNVDTLENLLPDRWVKSPTPPTEAAALIAR